MISIMKINARPYSMESVFKMINKSRQQYHQALKRKSLSKQFEIQLLGIVKEFRKTHPKMGSRTLYYSLIESGVSLNIGVNKFERFMVEQNLTMGLSSRYGPKTSDGKGRNGYPNLTNGLTLTNVNQLIVGDITYFLLEGEWNYLFTLKDVYSQFILSLIPSRSLEALVALKALKTCEKIRGSQSLINTIHHTDNGSQYESTLYVKHLSKLKMQISRAENCQQNGSSEQLNHIIKNMYLKHWTISNFKQLEEACKELQFINNHKRAIKQLGNIPPFKFEKEIQNIPIEQRNKKILHDFT